jgi:anti-sigma regulatory factor (Ser/Thr protein kinase)
MTKRAQLVVELPASRAAPRLGREFVRAALDEWGLAALADTATLLVSEVVTNAVVHANSRSILCVEQTPAAVRVTVTDRGAGVAAARRVDEGHEVWFDLGVPSAGATTDSPS